MAYPVSATYSSRTILNLEFTHYSAKPGIVPRLIFTLALSTPEHITTQAINLRAKLNIGDAFIGEGQVFHATEHLSRQGTGAALEIPVEYRALWAIESNFRGAAIAFTLQFSGVVRTRDDTPKDQLRFQPAVPIGEWAFLPIDMVNLNVLVSRSDWVEKVLKPIGRLDVITIEIPIPTMPNAQEFRTALQHIENADKHYRDANDAEALQSCWAAFDTLQGAPKQVFDKLADPDKRKQVDDLLLKFKTYLQSGRHPSKAGPHAGTFAVDRRDAEFAIGVSKLFLSYIARLLTP